MPTDRSCFNALGGCASAVGLVAGIAVLLLVALVFYTCGSFSMNFANNMVEQQKAEEFQKNPAPHTSKGSGVKILGCKVVESRFGHDIKVAIRNDSGQTIKACNIYVQTADDFGNSSYSDDHYLRMVESSQPLKSGKSLTLLFSSYGNNVVKASTVSQVLYADGKSWPEDFMKPGAK